MRLAIKFPEYVAQNTTKQKAMIPAVKRNGRRSGCPVPPECAIVFIYFKMENKDQNIIHDRCTRQNLPPRKLFWLRQNVMVIDLFIYTFAYHRFQHKSINVFFG